MVYSGKDEGRRREGVGLILEKETAIAPRIISAGLKAHPMNISFLQIYAPTTDSTDINLEAFHSSVQSAIDKLPPRDIL